MSIAHTTGQVSERGRDHTRDERSLRISSQCSKLKVMELPTVTSFTSARPIRGSSKVSWYEYSIITLLWEVDVVE